MLQLNNASLPGAASGEFNQAFASGEISVVLGPNKSGKTDLLRMIAGLVTPANGSVVLAGEVLDKTARRTNTALVYQAFVNYPNMTVAQNIASPLHARPARQKLSAENIVALVQQYAGMLKLDGLLARYPHELSGGQQQRVAIARALATRCCCPPDSSWG